MNILQNTQGKYIESSCANSHLTEELNDEKELLTTVKFFLCSQQPWDWALFVPEKKPTVKPEQGIGEQGLDR